MLGTNICIGEQKTCWLLLYKQLFLGVKVADTKYVAMAEHDCMYTDEHFSFKPPKDDRFYYNENHYLVQYSQKKHIELQGMYSRYWTQRLALSQMICNRDLLEETLDRRLSLLDRDRRLVRNILFAGEPGLSKVRIENAKKESRIKKIKKAQELAESGRSVYLKKYLQDALDAEKYEVFKTKIPNLDIRHDSNFTGPKRGKKRTWEIPYWGKFKDLIGQPGGNSER